MYQASWKNYLPHVGAILALLIFVWGAATYSIATLSSLFSETTIEFKVLSFEYPGSSNFVNSGDVPLFLSHVEIRTESPRAAQFIKINKPLEVGSVLSVSLGDGLSTSTLDDFPDERWIEAKNPASPFQRQFFSSRHPTLKMLRENIQNLRTVQSSCKVVAFGENPNDELLQEFDCQGTLRQKIE